MEAKNWEFKMGSAHGVLGMEVDVDNSSEGCIYGTVTNYVEWEFLKRTDAGIEKWGQRLTATVPQHQSRGESLARNP
ncbi:hypothetical protein PF005_g27314 [Phytophthora fragariae]|uniref:Uncharacterized protein n=1 Tax=Phytophthora fragariae TaxID=53985 RepID=A0A6A3K4Z6_9STRA